VALDFRVHLEGAGGQNRSNPDQIKAIPMESFQSRRIHAGGIAMEVHLDYPEGAPSHEGRAFPFRFHHNDDFGSSHIRARKEWLRAAAAAKNSVEPNTE
jgi:hypothetical protein